jgi:hypothetical protein
VDGLKYVGQWEKGNQSGLGWISKKHWLLDSGVFISKEYDRPISENDFIPK